MTLKRAINKILLHPVRNKSCHCSVPQSQSYERVLRMFNATEILINSFVQKLREGYHRTYGGLKADHEDIIAWAGSMAMENIANSDALYHNV